MPGSLLTRTWLKIRYYQRGCPLHDLFLRVLIDGLAKMGIRIEPYYLFLDGLCKDSLPHVEAGFEEYDLGFLGPQDMRTIAAIPGRIFSERELLLRLKEGKKCFGAKYRGEIVAFTWGNFAECAFGTYHLFLLKDNEVYLFDAYTVESFRGKGIAPYVRYRCYQELAKLGRERCYSITVLFNTPAIRFKKKSSNAQLLELSLFVELFKKWRFHSRLRKYRREN